ncbi:MAG TPA: hypothetical protein VF678_01830, partial [bacterium]
MPRIWLIAAALTLGAIPVFAHSPADSSAGRMLPTPATAAEVANYTAILGVQPILAATFGEDLAVAVVPTADG